MITLQISKLLPLKSACCCKYEGIAFDGCCFYLTNPACCEIHCFDHCFCECKVFSVCRAYASICYDGCLDCFWALPQREPGKIYKLDRCLKEVDYLIVNACNNIPLTLCGVACLDKDTLIISGYNTVSKICKINRAIPVELKSSKSCTKYASVECMNNTLICSYISDPCQTIMVCTPCGETLLQCCLPEDYFIEDMAAVLCCGDGLGTFYVLATKNYSYSYILKCSLFCTDDDECVCCKPSCNTPAKPPHRQDCSGSASSILESIALIETSLSHILNAEGEKIQKILSVSDSPDDIIRVNAEVNKTIVRVTHLEQVLFDKLQLASDLCHNKPLPPRPPCDPCGKGVCSKICEGFCNCVCDMLCESPKSS